MAERKVINKYYPPDFNPANIPRRRQAKNYQTKIRMMLPMTICCKTCSNYLYRGTKFNSRKETVSGETYLGIEIFRFYFKCTKCSAEISIKTDPKNSDYIEFGATRNFEPWRAEEEEIKKLKRKRKDEEMGDTMKVLENKTVDSKREIDIFGNLDEMRSMKARRTNVSIDAMLEILQRAREEKESLNEEDEAIVRSIFQGKSSKGLERRIAEAEDIDDDDGGGGLGLKFRTSNRRKLDEEQSKKQSDEVRKVGVIESCNDGKSFKLKDSSLRLMRVSVLKKKPLADSNGRNPRKGEENNEEAEVNSILTSNALVSLCQQYGVEEDQCN